MEAHLGAVAGDRLGRVKRSLEMQPRAGQSDHEKRGDHHDDQRDGSQIEFIRADHAATHIGAYRHQH
jgi:hypothetical protein